MNLRSAVERVVGIVLIDDELVDLCRANVKARCETVDVSKYKRRQAQQALEAEAKLAIVDTFSERSNRFHQVGKSWPAAHAIIKGKEAMVDIDIGLDYADEGDGVEPVVVTVFRSAQKRTVSDLLRSLGITQRKPTLDLTEPEPPPTLDLTEPAPPPPPPTRSRARELLDRKKG